MEWGDAIRSAQNPKLKSARALRKGRERCCTALEGWHLLEEALTAGVHPAWVLLREDRVEGLSEASLQLLQRAHAGGAEVSTCEAALMQEFTWIDGGGELYAWIERPTPCGEDLLEQLEPGDWCLLSAGVQDPGNLGALVRVAAGFGARAFLSLKGGGSVWHPRALRGASGTTFRLPIVEGLQLEALLPALQPHGLELWAADADGESIHSPDFLRSPAPVLLCMGEEGRGIPAELRAAAQRIVSIPLDRGVESLNVATAAAVLAAALRTTPPGSSS